MTGGGKTYNTTVMVRKSQKPKKLPEGREVKLGTVMTLRGPRPTRRTIREYYMALNSTAASVTAAPPAPTMTHAEAERQLDELGVR